MAKVLRFITASALFDGHDASINLMRRLIQAEGHEVIHLGHNRSAQEVADAAICEDADGIAISSYQGGHVDYFQYLRKLVDEEGGTNIKIFGGGGGVILPSERRLLESQGIEKIYSPQDGAELGLVGMIQDMIERTVSSPSSSPESSQSKRYQMAKKISAIESGALAFKAKGSVPVLGITGTGGAGKSSLIDELLIRFQTATPGIQIALISIDPTKKKTGGALLGDRIRITCSNNNFFVRSLATRYSNSELSPQIEQVVNYLTQEKFDLIIVETSGIGQASSAVTQVATNTLYLMTPEYGASSQLEKIEMLDYADFIGINKFEKPNARDAYRDVCKQVKRSRKWFEKETAELPVYALRCARSFDSGVNALFSDIVKALLPNLTIECELGKLEKYSDQSTALIAPDRVLYLRDIAGIIRSYNQETSRRCEILKAIEAIDVVKALGIDVDEKQLVSRKASLGDEPYRELQQFTENMNYFSSGNHFQSLSEISYPKVIPPKLTHLDDQYRFIRNTNFPGFFPFTQGVFPFKRDDEDPKRMFAGEGGPLRTNARFQFLSKNDPFKRLSTAFDSVTLYGEDPDYRPDIFGKIGESGVSICNLIDMQDLFKNINLLDPKTSVSMTINGPAAIILALFLNAACEQAQEGASKWPIADKIKLIQNIRGTVQADILKEDQAQNTCIFSLDFSLRLMGDVQSFFSAHKIKNYYTVSISGYHIAEAGANPITQLAFTLANGFTYVEYYLSRGLKIDDFTSNLSFFFSNGLDPEYSVLGSVARKIWAIAMRDRYGANDKGQKLKYHIQTSGRSLHAQEMSFNDIRTTLQAFLALSDNCNSLHTNAYDEAITTPTEESVRRAMAIQMIINREFGLNKFDNPLVGSFAFTQLCEIVEEYVLREFERISDRGGVLGAMESMYQRSKIQDESLYYEKQKDAGTLPIIGVNTFVDASEQSHVELSSVTRATKQEKEDQINRLKQFKNQNKEKYRDSIAKLQQAARDGKNIFEVLLEITPYCSLGEITHALYQVGGKYRRNI